MNKEEEREYREEYDHGHIHRAGVLWRRYHKKSKHKSLKESLRF